MSQLDRAILGEMGRSPRSLVQLAARVGADPRKVEERCRKLEKAGWLELCAPPRLATDILEVLRSGVTVTASELARKVGATEEEVAKACRSLRHYSEVSSIELGGDDAKILDALEGGEPVTTSKLAEQVGDDRTRVYGRCQRLGRAFVGSEPTKADKPLYFFTVTGDILTAVTYPRIRKVIDDLRKIVSRLEIPRGELSEAVKGRLCREFRAYLGRLANQAKPAERPQIRAFEAQLMAVLSGTKRSDVVGLFGLRRFYPTVRVWSLEAPANPSWREHWILHVRYWFISDEQSDGLPLRLRLLRPVGEGVPGVRMEAGQAG